MTSRDHAAPEDERTPLLQNGPRDVAKPKAAVTPLPYRALLVLCICRLTEPTALTVIMPFVNKAIEESGVPPSQVGFRAGIIEAAFTFAQFCVAVQLGKLSDVWGRKPVILIGMLGCSASVFAFGLARTFWMMVAARVICGLLNNNIIPIKSTLAELTDSTNEARAFSLLPIIWTLGSSLGPMLGGLLANPAERYPYTFGDIELFREYKYLLPCFVAGAFPLFGALLGWLFLKETLPKEEAEAGTQDAEAAAVPQPQEPVPSIRQVLTSRVRRALVAFAFLNFLSMSILGLLPLFLYTPISLGGLGFSEVQIGKALASQSILSAAIQLLVFPVLQRRLGTIRTFRLGASFYVLACALFPVTSGVARSGNLRWTWVALIAQVAVVAMGGIAFSCSALINNAAAPSQRSIGQINGLAQSVSTLVRSIALAGTPALFALTINKQLLGGQAIWLFLVLMACAFVGASWRVKDAVAEWRNERK